MTEFATSADGTRIAYDRFGSGPVVIFVDGAMQFRAFDPQTGELAEPLAERGFTTVRYDRRGRGESAFEGPFSLDQELADLRALIETVGGPAALYRQLLRRSHRPGRGGGRAPGQPAGALGGPAGCRAGRRGSRVPGRFPRARSRPGTEASLLYFMQDMPPEWVEGSRNSPAWAVMKALTPRP